MKSLSFEETRILLGRVPNARKIGPRGRLRRVLVVGGAGSIGSALATGLLDQGVPEVVVLDRDPEGLQTLDPRVDAIFGDLRELDLRGDPGHFDAVINAAALKDVCSLEGRAREAWEVNGRGALRVAHFALRAGAARLLHLSTDKAADPVSVMGRSKRLAELALMRAAERAQAPMVCLRLPNVLGTSGSVVPLFRSALESGETLPLRDPESTRYYLSLEEAVAELLHALTLPTGVYLSGLQLEALPLGELARRACDLWGSAESWPEETLALGPGEKRHEALLGHDERAHPLDERLARVEFLRDPEEEWKEQLAHLGVEA